MRPHSRRFKRALKIFSAAVGLTGSAAHADGIVSPGILASWTFGEGGGFGLGTEVSYMYHPGGRFEDPPPHGGHLATGAFLQAEKLFGEGRSFRGALGLQAAPRALPIAGAEAGIAVQRDTAWRGGIHGGLFGSLGFVGIAYRGTFASFGAGGAHSALVFTLKAPLWRELYGGCVPGICVEGRPLRGGDGMLLPDVSETADARALPLGLLRRVTAAEQERRAAKWLSAARAEYASIPAFLELASDLGRVGAPATLVDAALTAAQDEVRHARACFALASLYAERPLAPVWMPEWMRSSRAKEDRHEELARLAHESWVDGWLGEGTAARRAALEAATEADPVVARVQREIAREEAAHAVLGARIARWSVDAAARL